MTDCTVTCTECRTEKDTPMIWHWLCEECAHKCADRHQRDTGHTVDLHVTVEPTVESLQKTCQAAAILRHRERFW